jgi:ribosome-binding factor A
LPKSFSRAVRIGDQIQRELAELIRLEVKDPRVGMVTITAVQVAFDYSHAKIFFTTLGDQQSLDECLAGLNHAAGYLRNQLFHRLQLRVVPQLNFVYDESVARGIRLSSLIDEAVASERRDESEA